MGTIQVMRKALEALETIGERFGPVRSDLIFSKRDAIDKASAAITALRAELERLEAVEPVAYRWQPSKFFADFVLTADAGRAALAREFGLAVESLYTAPIAPAIPALTIEDVAESAPEFADVPKYGPAYLAGAHWAYTLAAARTGARIIKADPLQELADDARQIGLEY